MKIFFALVIIAVLVSYFSFKKKYKMDTMLCGYLGQKYKQAPNTTNEKEYASALMVCQKYRTALELFEDLKRKGVDKEIGLINDNIKICRKPLPWSTKVRNYNGSWLHSILFSCFGGKRRVLISRDTYKEADAMIRAMNKH